MSDEEKIEALKVPDFKSVIPSYLADGLTPAERHTIETLSIMAQKLDWCTERLTEGHKKIEACHKRTEKYESIIVALKSKWAIVGYVLMLIAPSLVLRLLNKLWPV